MSRTALFAIAIAALGLGTTAEADQKNKQDKGKDKHAATQCPPGLAKKNGHCLPPGQAKKSAGAAATPAPAILVWPVLGLGDLHPKDVITILDPEDYAVDPEAIFVRFGTNIYRLHRSDGTVLNWVGEGWTWDGDWADLQSCPPGLARKDPPCVPPGQAKKGGTAGGVDLIAQGDQLPGGYEVLIDPAQFTPAANTRFVRYGNTIYRVDQDSGTVLDVINLLAN